MENKDEMPEQLLALASYLGSSDEEKSMELLASSAHLLSEDEAIALVEEALQYVDGSDLDAMKTYLDSLDEDDLYTLVSDYDGKARAMLRAAPSGLLSDLEERWMSSTPEDAPSWMFFDFRGIYPSSWLLHCSDEGRSVSYEGFTRGVEDIGKLGLTTHLSDAEKRLPGFNFAYESGAFERYAFDRGRCRYGSNVILLRAPYVLTWHHNDSEPQAIFWGPSATDIILLDQASRGHYELRLDPPEDLPDEEYEEDDWMIYASNIDDLIDQIEDKIEYVDRLSNPFDPYSTHSTKRRVLR